jgi:hypothetical protein
MRPFPGCICLERESTEGERHGDRCMNPEPAVNRSPRLHRGEPGGSTAAAAVVFPEFLEALGVGAPEVGQGREGRERLRAEVMFDVLDLDLDGLGFKPHEGEQFREGAVAVLDVRGDLPALVGEGESPVALVVHKPAAGQAADHVGNGRTAEPEGFGEVGHPGIADTIDELLDPFEVILGGFGAGVACIAGDPGHGWEHGVGGGCASRELAGKN